MNFQKVLALTVTLLFLQGCASIYKTQNSAITKVGSDTGYYRSNHDGTAIGDYLITLSFSGGGTRASALSYGVLKELRDIQIDAADGTRTRLLDEVDNISSVSGGSFTAAYYGLFGDQIFEDYESRFLRQSVQGALIRKLFNPVYWWRSLFTGLDRTEMAVEYYDRTIFQGKTFADMPRSDRAFIEINATDLNAGNRFTFSQTSFDLICSDLNSFSVARAVTASSAVPVAFPPIVLKNHADECDITENPAWQTAMDNMSHGDRSKPILDYVTALRDVEAHPYIHLVDGGISDNLGLRTILARVEAMGGVEGALERSPNLPKDIVLILVNAEVKPKRSIDQSAAKPSVGATIAAMSSAQIGLYNLETLALIKERIQVYEEQLLALGHPTRFYFIELSFESIKQPNIKEFFNSLPTSLELSNTEVDTLIEAGRLLLREHPDFQEFLTAHNGVLEQQGESEMNCKALDAACWLRAIAIGEGKEVPDEAPSEK